MCYGFLGGSKVPEDFDMVSLFKKRASLLSTTLRSRSNDYKAELMAKMIQRCKQGFENGTLQVVIDREFKMS